jgi:DNA-binding CsgD family transcriptional regulator
MAPVTGSPLQRLATAIAAPSISPLRAGGNIRPSLAAFLDLIGEALAIYTNRGVVVFENRAFLALLGADSGTADIRLALGQVSRDARPGQNVLQQISVAGRNLCVDAAPLPSDVLWPEGARLLRVMPLALRELDPVRVAAAFGLTRRQAEVAVLLAQGLGNRAIASSLGISPHTGRRHTEQVLARLGVCSRARVACLLGGQRVYSM